MRVLAFLVFLTGTIAATGATESFRSETGKRTSVQPGTSAASVCAAPPEPGPQTGCSYTELRCACDRNGRNCGWRVFCVQLYPRGDDRQQQRTPASRAILSEAAGGCELTRPAALYCDSASARSAAR